MQYKDCKISEVYQRIDSSLTGTLMLEISYKENKTDIISKIKMIKINHSKDKLKEDIKRLLNKEIKTCYLAYGMQNIDITLDYIKYSPSDLFEADYFFFKKGEIDKLLKALS